MNLTEPQAARTSAPVRTRAMPEGDALPDLRPEDLHHLRRARLTENIVHLVLARTPDAPEGVKGISLFVVPKFLVNADGTLGARNDVHCVSIEHKLGIHASPTCVMAYGDKDGAIGYLVGEENRGLEYMFIMMNAARFAVGMEGVAIAERAYQHALAYARDRVQGKAVGAEQAAEAGADHRAPGRAPHADDHEGADRGDARAGLRHRRRARQGAAPSGCRGAQRGTRRSST